MSVYVQILSRIVLVAAYRSGIVGPLEHTRGTEGGNGTGECRRAAAITYAEALTPRDDRIAS